MTRFAIPNVERYIPALDGLRAGAVLIVILAHFGLERYVPGGFGVTAFFWISGFLITGQLLGECQRSGGIDLARFYMRRILRLMPAAFLYITVAAIAFMLAGGPTSSFGLLAAYFYGANYYNLFVGYPMLGAGGLNPLTHLWSLAVEEHYYIVWPLLLAALFRWRIAAQALIAVCVLILAWRYALFQSCYVGGQPGPAGGICGELVQYRIYMATDTRLDAIAWGALVAVLAASSWRGRLERVLQSRPVQAAALVLLAASFVIGGNAFREVWRYTLQGVALSVLVPAVLGVPTLLRRFLEMPVVVLVGRLSYSLYLWHWGGVCFADWYAHKHGAAWLACAVTVTLVGSLFSYYAIERPMLAMRRRAGSHAGSEMAPAG